MATAQSAVIRVDVSAAANDVGAAGGSVVVVVFGQPPWLRGWEILRVENDEVQG